MSRKPADYPEGQTMGRPKIEFTEREWKLLEAVCQYKHPEEDVAAILGCSVTTLVERIKERYGCSFRDFRQQKMAAVKHNLFAAQYKTAIEDKNPTMQIWLGKQMLGQTDKKESHHTLEVDGPVFIDEEEPEDES